VSAITSTAAEEAGEESSSNNASDNSSADSSTVNSDNSENSVEYSVNGDSRGGVDRPAVTFERISNVVFPYITGIAVRP